MKKALSLVCTLLAGFVLSTASFAQSSAPYNPDFNGDGYIGVDDILGVLTYYDLEWVNVSNSSWSCGDDVLYGGHSYSTVIIGDHCWFAENLRVKTYTNGDDLVDLSDVGDMQPLIDGETGARSTYDFDLSMETAYGGLYNWYAVNDPRGLCPSS